MKIGLHVNQLDHRGNSTVVYDYAIALKNILGHTPTVVSSRVKSNHPIDRFSEFGVHLYDDMSELTGIVDKEKIDVLYMSRAGNNNEFTPTNCKTAIHAIFDMREPHGNVYAGVSEWLAKFFNKELWVPHIIDVPKVNETLHGDLGIPKTDFIVGRLGGYDQFDVPFAHTAIAKVLEQRSDLWAIFLNTRPFIEHPRVKFLPFHPDPLYKSKFINTCDAMLHARTDGETFGLAVAEFSSLNKPVITYDAPYWWYMKAHLDMLGDKAIKYRDESELLTYLKDIDKEYVKDVEWDCYSVKFSPTNVIKKFDEVFIK
jgi:glycosyltransferase involved in cell wall biosynthesis